MYVTLVLKTKGTRLTKPTISLTLLCLAALVGVIRVAEYRNHWADVLAGFFTGAAIAVFLVRARVLCWWRLSSPALTSSLSVSRSLASLTISSSCSVLLRRRGPIAPSRCWAFPWRRCPVWRVHSKS